MILDAHVHLCAFTPGHGRTSRLVLDSLPFRFMRWRLGMIGSDAATERALERKLLQTIAGTPEIDGVVLLAFDAVYDQHGRRDDARTHLWLTNDYAIDLVARHPKLHFGASVHPYREDAVAEIERCVRAGAVLLKWLPIVQDIDPSDERCFPVYDALAHHGLPLLSHTGGEKSLPNINPHVADPALLEPALRRGVTVVAAHCGTRSAPGEADFLPTFVRMAKDHERLYGDTAALNLPTRCYAYPKLLADDAVRRKLVHGSDWPIIALPPPSQIGWDGAAEAMQEANWMRRDVLIKRRLGFDPAYWHRAAEVLRGVAKSEAASNAAAP